MIADSCVAAFVRMANAATTGACSRTNEYVIPGIVPTQALGQFLTACQLSRACLSILTVLTPSTANYNTFRKGHRSRNGWSGEVGCATKRSQSALAGRRTSDVIQSACQFFWLHL